MTYTIYIIHRTIPHHLDGQVAYLMTNIVKENCHKLTQPEQKGEES